MAFANDVRFVLRQLRRQPAFAATAILTLALCLGANTVLFSALHALIWRSLPYPQSDRLMALHRNGNAASASWREIEAISQARSLEASAGITLRTWGLTREAGARGSADVVLSGMFTPGWFDVLGVTPLVGRTPARTDHRQVWLSYSLWQSQFQGDVHVPGATIQLNEEPYTIAGVLPQWFQFQYQDKAPDLYFPLERGYNATHVVVRLASPGPGAVAQAERELREITASAGEPTANQLGLRDVRRELHGGADEPYYLLLAAVAVIFLIACLNLANLFLARLGGRDREFAIRLSIGAGKRQLVRLILIETAIVCALGTAGGLVIAAWSPRFFGLSGLFLPRVDLFATGFLALSAVVATSLISLAPMAATLRTRPVGNRRGRLRGMLIAGQVAGGFALLTVTLLLLRSFEQVTAVAPGFDPGNVVIGGIGLPEVRYNTSESMVRFYERVQEEASSILGVQEVSLATAVPLVNSNGARIRIDNTQQTEAQFPLVRISMVAPSYFQTMKIPLQQGRTFEATDRTGEHPRTAIVNQAFVRAFGTKLGQEVRLSWWNGEHPQWTPWQIAGVVGNTRSMRLDERADLPYVYLPLYQFVSEGVRVLIRTRPGQEGSVIRELSARMRQIDPKLEDVRFRPLSTDIRATLQIRRQSLQLFGLFGLAALALCGAGLFGLAAGAVREQSRDLAVRRALGAPTASVVRSAFQNALRWAAAGLALGVLFAYWAARAVTGQLFGITVLDPASWLLAASTLLLALLAGGVLPARRAARVDPAVLLRHE